MSIINKLEPIEPYKELFGGGGGSSKKTTQEEKKLTISEKIKQNKNKKLEQKLEKAIPEKENFETTIRQKVKNINTYYNYEIYQEKKKEETGISIYPAKYKYKESALYEFYITMIGAIDKEIETINGWIEFDKSFNNSFTKKEQIKKNLFNLRNKIIEDLKKEVTPQTIELEDLSLAYPLYSHFDELCKKDFGNRFSLEETKLAFIKAYSEGYLAFISKPEDLVEIYKENRKNLVQEKEKSKKLIKYRPINSNK